MDDPTVALEEGGVTTEAADESGTIPLLFLIDSADSVVSVLWGIGGSGTSGDLGGDRRAGSAGGGA